MKTARHLERLEPLILQPLHGLSKNDWHGAPRGKWSIVQIVQHVAIGIDLVAHSFRELAESLPMDRQNKPHQTVLRHLTLGAGHYPGTLKALPHAKPDAKPDAELVSAQFRMGVEEYRKLTGSWPQDAQLSRFVPHPLLGDLNLPEWIRFHYLHSRHHAREIRARLKWLGK
jgi:hypothetical protein